MPRIKKTSIFFHGINAEFQWPSMFSYDDFCAFLNWISPTWSWVENWSPTMGRGINSRNRVWNWVGKLDRLAGRYDNHMPTWFLAPIVGLKLPTLVYLTFMNFNIFTVYTLGLSCDLPVSTDSRTSDRNAEEYQIMMSPLFSCLCVPGGPSEGEASGSGTGTALLFPRNNSACCKAGENDTAESNPHRVIATVKGLQSKFVNWDVQLKNRARYFIARIF